MTDPKRPPLAKAAREFLMGVQLPPPPKHGPNPNKDYALLLHAMLWHAREVKEDAQYVKCSPSLKQLAALMFCSVRTVQCVMQQLISIGIVEIYRRGLHSDAFEKENLRPVAPKPPRRSSESRDERRVPLYAK